MISDSLWECQHANKALAPYGFKDWKYGDVRYHFVWRSLANADTDICARLEIVADHRPMGLVTIFVDGGGARSPTPG